MSSMFDSGYVPGGITSLLQSKPAKKKKEAKEENDVNEEEQSTALKELFTTQPTDAEAPKSAKKSKKRKHSEVETKEAKVEEDAAAAGKHPKRKRKSDYVDDVERRKRTVFVGNVPNLSEKKALKRLFKKFGDIETLRFRSVTTNDPKAPKKKAIAKGEFHPNRSSMNAYIVFKEIDSAKAALVMNGEEFEQHHLRVDLAFSAKQHDHSRCVFVGSLPYDAEDEDLRKHFADCGAIDNVRIIRDKASGMGKGFGYIKFQEKGSVEFAMKLDGEKFKNRRLRIQPSKKQDGVAEKPAPAKKSAKTPPKPGAKPSSKPGSKPVNRASNATQGSFSGEQADTLKERNKLKKQKKIKKRKELQKNKKMAKVLSGGEGKKTSESKEPKEPKKAFKKLNKKVQVRNRIAKKKKKVEKK